MRKNSCFVDSLSPYLFWDVDRSHIDEQQHERFIIGRVLKVGLMKDWKLILGNYGLHKIIDVAMTMKELDRKTASFLSLLGGVSKDKFICYSTKQSIPPHWNF